MTVQQLIQDVKQKYSHLKRCEDTIALVGPKLQGNTDLQQLVFSQALAISGPNATAVNNAMDTNVGIAGRLSGSQASRDLARFAVLVEAVLIHMRNPDARDYSAVASVASPLARGAQSAARDAVVARLTEIQTIDAQEKAKLAAKLAEKAKEEEQARRDAAELAKRKSIVLTLAEGAKAERQRRIDVMEGAKRRYETGVSAMADGRQAIRRDLEAYSIQFVVDILNRYLSVVIVMDASLVKVETVLGMAAKAAADRTKFKRELATALFKAIRQYAPPPFNLAGALVEAGINVALDIYNATKNSILADTQLTVTGAELGKKALDFMQDQITSRIRDQNVPTMASINGDATVQGMLNNAREEAIAMVRSALQKVLAEREMLRQGSEEEDYGHQRAHVRTHMAFATIAGARALPPPDPDVRRAVPVAQPVPVGRRNFLEQVDARLADANETQRATFRRMRDQLESVSRVGAPAPNTSDEFQRFTMIFVYAVAMKARVDANKAARILPKLEKADIDFLASSAVGLIKVESKSAAKAAASAAPSASTAPTLPIPYKAGNTANFVVVSTLLEFAASDINPFAAAFSSKADPVGAMKANFMALYLANHAFGEQIRRDAATKSSTFETKTGFKEKAYAKKLYG